jgi:hypothetical protein
MPSAELRSKSSRLDFLRSRWHPPYWLSSKRPNNERGVLLISAGAIEERFEGKTLREAHQGALFMHDNAPAHRALETRKKLACLALQCVDHPPYSPDLTPSDYHLFPCTERTIEWSQFFIWHVGHCCRGDLVGRTIFWFFGGWGGVVCKRYSNGLRSVLSFMGSALKKSRVWSL